MLTFNQCVFDGFVSGTAPIYSYSEHNPLLGTADQLSISGYTAQVSTTSGTPALAVQVEHSFDNIRWTVRNATAEISSSTTTLATGTVETNVQGQDGNPTTRPTLAFARLRIQLSGGGVSGQVRLWVTGRDRQGG
jgi:hypothetical protein